MSKEVALDWKAALAKQVQKVQVDADSGDKKYISLKGGRMTLGDKPIPNDELECIVLANGVERAWFARPYSPDDKNPPDCYSLDGHKPADNVPAPPSSQCAGCPMAEFGTALQGKGPACKTKLRLCVAPAPTDLKPEHLGDGTELATMKVSPTSVVNFSGKEGYEQELAKDGQAPWSVVTKIMVRPHPKKLNEVTFKKVRNLEKEELLAASFKQVDRAVKEISTAWNYADLEELAK